MESRRVIVGSITVTDLASLAYNGGASTGNDDLWFRANDGAQWGGWVRTRITNRGESPPVDAVLTPTLTVARNQSVQLSTIFSASDPDGDTITQYQVWLGDDLPGDVIHGSLSQNNKIGRAHV